MAQTVGDESIESRSAICAEAARLGSSIIVVGERPLRPRTIRNAATGALALVQPHKPCKMSHRSALRNGTGAARGKRAQPSAKPKDHGHTVAIERG